jgi:hypothetical protein
VQKHPLEDAGRVGPRHSSIGSGLEGLNGSDNSTGGDALPVQVVELEVGRMKTKEMTRKVVIERLAPYDSSS